jgi:hypothetical protein
MGAAKAAKAPTQTMKAVLRVDSVLDGTNEKEFTAEQKEYFLEARRAINSLLESLKVTGN